MIFVNIQGKSNFSEQELAIDGKVIDDNDKAYYLSILSKKIGLKNLKIDGKIHNLNKCGDYYCYLTHPETDNIGRERLALIVWNKKDSRKLKLIKKTIEIINLDFNEFENIRKKYNNKHILILSFVFAVLAFITKIFTIFKIHNFTKEEKNE